MKPFLSLAMLWVFLSLGLPPAWGAQAQLTFEQDGKSYAIEDGAVYQIKPNGRRKFVDQLYQTDFFEKNYRVQNGIPFRVDPESGKLYPVSRVFHEDFEGVESVPELFSEARWHSSNVDPKRAGQKDNYYAFGNRIALSGKTVHQGKVSLKCSAVPNRKDVSKASISKGLMHFKKGDEVYTSGWFFVEETPSLYDAGGFTLFDLESTFLKGSVGLRVIFRRNDSLAFELKLPKVQFQQARGAEVRFPAGQWVHVETRSLLSDEAGRVRIWQDGRLVLDQTARTLPLADTIYDRFEVGVSAIAKGSRYGKTVYVDDLVISAAPNYF